MCCVVPSSYSWLIPYSFNAHPGDSEYTLFDAVVSAGQYEAIRKKVYFYYIPLKPQK